MAKKTGLGKGLGALFNDNFIEEEEESKVDIKEGEEVVHKVKIIEIEPNKNQPRRKFDEEALEELSQSIKNYGVIQPIIVAKKDNYYEIVAGERRWRAAKKAGLDEIPCIIREDSERKNKEIALIENIQREDLNSIEKARGYKQLADEYGLTQAELAEIMGKSQAGIANTMRLLNLDERVINLIIDGKLSEGHGRPILYFDDPDEQYNMALQVIEKGLSVRETEQAVKKTKYTRERTKVRKEDAKRNAIVQDIEDKFQEYFGAKVKLQAGRRSGKIIIQYSSNEELDRIMDLIKR